MKSTKAEVRQRVNEVFKLRLGGAEFADIREYAAAPERAWGVSDTQLWRYIRGADTLCKDHFDAQAEHLLNRHLLQRRTLYAHAMGAGDFRTALAVLQDEAKLEGLYPATKTELTGKNGGPMVFCLEEVIAADRAIAAQEMEEWQRDRLHRNGSLPLPQGGPQVP
jgi:hypothetical protein